MGGDLTLAGGIESEISDQLVKVLRAGKGDTVVLISGVTGGDGAEGGGAGAGDGAAGGAGAGGPYYEYVYEVESAHKKEIALKFIEKKENLNECGRRLNLILCLPNKPDKLSLILQKAVELGVSEVTLVSGDNSQMKHEIKTERLNRIMKEAAEQSERAFVPGVCLEGGLTDFLGGLEAAARGDVLVALERSDAPALTDMQAVTDGITKKNAAGLFLIVGPEGGFSEREKSFFAEKDYAIFSLGKRILRMETAAIVALGVLTMKG